MNEHEKELSYPLADHLPPSDGMTEVAPGVFWVRMSLPFALDHINLWLLRDALEMIQSLPWESETSTQKRGETLQGHRDRMSSVMERNEMRRDLISAIEATLAQQAEPVADSGNPSY